MTCAAVVGAVSSSLCTVKHVCVVCGVWCVECGVWCVECGVCGVCGVYVCVVDM